MRRAIAVSTLSAGLILGAPTAAMATTTHSSAPSTTARSSSALGHHHRYGHVSKQDLEWFTTAAAGDQFEIQGGKLALQRAKNSATRAYAWRLITDHTKAYAQKKQIAVKLHLRLPDRPTSDMQEELNKLKPLHGHAFDVAYLKTEISDHHKDISDTKKEIDSGHNRLIVHQAKRELPVLQTHLRLGECTLDEIGGE